MSTIDDTLAELDLDTIVNFLEGRGVLCVHPGEVFPKLHDAENVNMIVRIATVSDKESGRPVLEVRGCNMKTITALVNLVDELRRYRVENE